MLTFSIPSLQKSSKQQKVFQDSVSKTMGHALIAGVSEAKIDKMVADNKNGLSSLETKTDLHGYFYSRVGGRN